jgi:molybdopterin-guanine dinucleotide biosynthesis protein A
MIKLRNMLMIGAARSNLGKTDLACELIDRFGRLHEVIAVKVTTIRETEGSCPRGGEGCGVCSEFNGRYCITEEGQEPPGKDTARMHAAGAGKVLWLRVMDDHIEEGVTALLESIDRGAAIVCESNSLRRIVEPGLFLMVKDRSSSTYKPSAEFAKRYADRIVGYDGETFDFDIGDITFTGGAWAIKADAAAIIMAGGKSTRMGRDKAMLPIDGRPMIEHICNTMRPHFRQLLISAGDARKYSFLGIEVVTDRLPDHGPLMGIACALEASAHELNVVVACDMPDLDIDFIKGMIRGCEDYDAVVPRTGGSFLEPLCAVYRKSMVKPLNDALTAGEIKVSDVLRRCNVKYIDTRDTGSLRNINTAKEYESYVTGRGGSGGGRGNVHDNV